MAHTLLTSQYAVVCMNLVCNKSSCSEAGRPGGLSKVVTVESYIPGTINVIVLVREFQSRRGEVLNLFAMIKEDQSL